MNGGLGEQYIKHFDMGANAIMGTLTGTAGNAFDGLVIDIEMKPLALPNRKPGQLGYGGNWTTDDFGYSNWMYWSITQNNTNINLGPLNTQYHGDVNFTLVATPIPAGLPLVLTGLAGLYALRRRKAAA